ncbi:MAG: hypothetical protein OEZ22_03665 [Spirochaetia bacterium]|nr:hypothetical protein [Spirochaetia bacterium]
MNRIVLVYKKTLIDIFKEKAFESVFEEKRYALFNQIKKSHYNHEKSIENVLNILEKIGIKTVIYARGSGRMPVIKENDLAVSLGGDGTFIFTSHHCKKNHILGLNSAPQTSIGHYCHAIYAGETQKLERLFDKILSGREKPRQIQRLDFFINNKFCGVPVINDVLVSESSPCTTSRYIIKYNQKSQSQKSSGIWITTATGSSAAYYSAGGKVFEAFNKKKQRQFAFQVRELYGPKKDSIRNGMVNENDKFKVISGMARGKIFLDGSHRFFSFIFGDELTVKFSKNPLLVFN